MATIRFRNLQFLFLSGGATVFCGHSHGCGETLRDGVRYIVTGGTGSGPGQHQRGQARRVQQCAGETVRDGRDMMLQAALQPRKRQNRPLRFMIHDCFR